MNKIFLDVTQLISWKGGLTGIPRTTDEIALRLRHLDNAGFVTWDVGQKRFREVDIEQYYSVVAPYNRAFFNNKAVVEAENTPSMSDSLVFKFKDRVNKTPIAGRAARSLKKQLKSRPENEPENTHIKQWIVLGTGDTLLIPCGIWDDKHYIQTTLGFRQGGAKLSFICYDMLPIVVPQFSGQWGAPLEEFTRDVTAQCDVVFSISEYTKKDLAAWLEANNLPVPNTEVIRLGDSFKLSNEKVPGDPAFINSGILDSGEEFILCAGTVEARKNHTLLYYTYKLAHSRGIKLPKTVVVGRPGHRTENIIDIIRDDPEVNKQIIMLFNTSDQELSWLYKHCRFTIYPSFYEGWGLPIAESIANGIPCICSNTSSMIEVAPGIAAHFNPASPDECLEAIQNYMDETKYKAAQAKAKTYKPVSWDRTYDEVIAALAPL